MFSDDPRKSELTRGCSVLLGELDDFVGEYEVLWEVLLGEAGCTQTPVIVFEVSARVVPEGFYQPHN